MSSPAPVTLVMPFPPPLERLPKPDTNNRFSKNTLRYIWRISCMFKDIRIDPPYSIALQMTFPCCSKGDAFNVAQAVYHALDCARVIKSVWHVHHTDIMHCGVDCRRPKVVVTISQITDPATLALYKCRSSDNRTRGPVPKFLVCNPTAGISPVR